jgi:aryl-alcohol dehydrogenase-like predicted oxidoreductase
MNRPVGETLKKSLESTKVEYVRLGSSGLRVSWPILGTMAFGAKSLVPWMLDDEAGLEMLKAAYDRGINTWDTANTYANGAGERVISMALDKFNIPREKVVIMTKCYSYVGQSPDVIGTADGHLLGGSKDYVNQGGEYSDICFAKVAAP